MQPALLTSERDDWLTPQWFVELVVALLDGVDLDPCSNVASLVPATHRIMPPDDGLSISWCGGVYVNPPYGREIVKWVEKCALHAEQGAEIVALVPARTDTKWWQKHATTATSICFLRGRIKFLQGGQERHPAPFPSAVLYWGPCAVAFQGLFSGHGWIVDTGRKE